jgi:hypothetical protein
MSLITQKYSQSELLSVIVIITKHDICHIENTEESAVTTRNGR